MPSPSPVYLDAELALSQIGDADTLHAMLLMLEESLARDVPLIATHFQAGDVPAANRLLHAIKGFVPIFCPPDFCSRVVAVEAMSKDAASTTAGPAYAELQPALEQLLQDVRDHLRGRAGAG